MASTLWIVAALALSALFAGCLAKPSSEDWVYTPSGLRHYSCVHEVPSGAHIDEKNSDERGIRVILPEGSETRIPHCQYPAERLISADLKRIATNGPQVSGDGWQVFTYYNGGDQLSTFNGQWVVPAGPQKSGGQILYLFTGLVNEYSANEVEDIIQPVLQWGKTPAGGGAYWALASWYVTSSGAAVHSKVIKANTGDTIFGVMEETPAGSGQWFISSNDTTTSPVTSTYITVSKANTKTEPWAFCTLEVYEVANCMDYPPTTTTVDFTQLYIVSGQGVENATWTTSSQQQICKEQVTVVSPSAVTITF